MATELQKAKKFRTICLPNKSSKLGSMIAIESMNKGHQKKK